MIAAPSATANASTTTTKATKMTTIKCASKHEHEHRRCRTRVVAHASRADGEESASNDARAVTRRVTLGLAASVAAMMGSSARAAEDEVVAAAASDDAVAEAVVAAPVEPVVPQGTSDALSAYDQMTRTGGNSSTAKALVAKGSGSSSRVSATKKSSDDEGSGPPFAAIPVVLGLGWFAAFKALSGG